MGIPQPGVVGSDLSETAARRPSTLVLGLGNPILGDDGVGWKVAQHVRDALGPESPDVDVDFASLGGLSLMERMLGYRRVILIDSIETQAHREGAVSVFPLQALRDPSSGHSASAHDTSLTTALQTAQVMGEHIPDAVEVVAIEARITYDFTESLSAAVEASVPIATRKVLELLRVTS